MSHNVTALRQPADGLRIQPLTAPLGAEIHNLDARVDPTPEQVLALKQALRDHHILIFKRQQLDDAQFLRFTSWFGSVFQPHPDFPVLSSGADGKAPDIVKVANTEDGELGNFALPAHSDHQWTPTPSAGSLLYALEVPEEGGETRWTNLALAYSALDEDTRREIDGLKLINYNPFVRIKSGGYNGGFVTYRTPDIEPIQGTEHPLVRTHPESGKKLLFLSVHTEVEIPGYDPEKGAALIARLREHLGDPRFSYTHTWEVGDIVYWDNQATLHARNAFPATQRRRLKRISLAGSRPF
ncbi:MULTISPECIES: TauD/TfdA family dioxygenase [unclassified Pseudomonas]|uniref:TauD/TfdA dioxygenase family protein n=1 Tax=unclassified Pseudomonas TaxID=196821 RepID=UPI00244A2694|nr:MULTISPECIES: TauD/TfdA family dioxygenase [unclassified Pseudomonas]MDH0896082.1 TauD/TfdA family dioxygenase [Pseudomonas sp. GD03875]MDH1067339.1 TauD/TfdA family dioxygenase [Pseudomonas sp. GD03985]